MAPMAIAAVAVMAVGAAASAYAAYRSTAAQKQSASYNAKVQQQNAKLAELQAQDTEARGRLEEDAYRRQLGQAQGAQLNALAATGVQLGSGSALDLAQDLRTAGSLDSLAIRMNTQREAYAQRLQGTGALAEAALARNQASWAKPGLAAGLSAAGSAGSFASMWYMSQPPAAPPGATSPQATASRTPGGPRQRFG
jgi:hypothetical protein